VREFERVERVAVLRVPVIRETSEVVRKGALVRLRGESIVFHD
jgi:hypothetical protein